MNNLRLIIISWLLVCSSSALADNFYCPATVECKGNVCDAPGGSMFSAYVYPLGYPIKNPDGIYKFVGASDIPPYAGYGRTEEEAWCQYQYGIGYGTSLTNQDNLTADINVSNNAWRVVSNTLYGCTSSSGNPHDCPFKLLSK